MLRPHLNSTVGRRLFLSFLLVALLPTGGLALYAYRQVGDMLLEINDRRLKQDSKALGMALIQELNWRAHVLTGHAKHAVVAAETNPAVPEGFVGLGPLPDNRSITPAQIHHLDLGRIVFTLDPAGKAGMLIRPSPGEPVQFAHLDPHAFWNNDQAVEDFCILGMALQTYFCTPGMQPPKPEAWPDQLARLNSGNFDWRFGSEDYLGGFWQARLQAAYAHPGFIVLVAEPKQALLRNLRQFRLAFFATALLAFGLALLLALSQIRRQMRPLDQLTQGTRRLAAGDFTTRGKGTGDDEFGSLAQSFNQMSDTLRHKFHMLHMLAELDRAILSTSEMDYVIESVLGNIHASIPCDSAGILRLDDHGGGRLLAAGSPQEATPIHGRDFPNVGCLLPEDTTRAWYRLEFGEARPDCLHQMTDQPIEQALIFPVRVNARIDSLLILAYRHPPEALDEIVEAGCGLTDRLAVAASNIAWEERLYHQGHYDALTDLPNRVLLRDRVEQALMRAEREQTSVAVLLIDLDNFKEINDSLGHSAGDQLLVECSRRLKDATRQSDTAARLGGDEFVLLIPDLARGSEIAMLDTLARKLNSALARPMLIAERLVTTPASIGIALYPTNATGVEDLLKMADAAMYESKRHQPGAFRFYSGEMNAEVRGHFELTQDLRTAIGNDELVLYYQPKVSALTGHIVAAEALVRWNSPRRGLVPPGLFVPVIDEIGLGSWLGEWVMERACAQMAEWDRLGLPPIPVSVNIAPQQFHEGNLIDKVNAVLSEYALSTDRLELEILEATAANESTEIHATLTDLRAMGIGIALDDFGTGYTSLVYLTQLPANILKLDRAFISSLTTDARQRAIVESIIALARALDFVVVAEGVEEAAQMSLLAAMGCHLIQGYLISRPVPPEAFAELLRRNPPASGQ